MSHPHTLLGNLACPPSAKRRTPPENFDKCVQLTRNINALRQKRQGIFRKWLQIESERRQAWNAVDRLSDKLWNQRKIQLALNAVGFAVSGGAASAVAGAVGNAISTIGTLLGFLPIGRQLKSSLEKVASLSFEFERLGGDLDYYEAAIADMHKRRRELDCPGF